MKMDIGDGLCFAGQLRSVEIRDVVAAAVEQVQSFELQCERAGQPTTGLGVDDRGRASAREAILGAFVDRLAVFRRCSSRWTALPP